MRKLGWTLGAAAALAFAPAQAMAGIGGNLFWSWSNVCGGNNFVTCSSGSFSYDAEDGVIEVTITNEAVETDVFRGIGLFNLSVLPTDWEALEEPGASSWAEGSLPAGGVPTTGRFTVRGDGNPEALPEGPTFTFRFYFDDFVDNIGDVGVMYHAISGPGGCSTTVGVVYDGDDGGLPVQNSSDLDPACTPTEMPEPGTMILFVTGLAAMLGIARRREDEEV